MNWPGAATGGLLAFSPDSRPAPRRSAAIAAKLSVGQSGRHGQGEELWLTGKNQPAPVNRCSAHGATPVSRIRWPYLERIRTAMKPGNIELVKSLAQQMPANYQSIASAVA